MDELANLVTQQKFRAGELHDFSAYIGEFSNIALITVSGDPPDDYLLSFDLVSLVPKEGGGLKGGRGHRILFHLPVDYPQDPPEVRALTPIFHPAVNPASGEIDVSEVWRSAPSLRAVANYLARLLTGEVYRLPNPANPEAVAVYDRIAAKLPLDAPARAENEKGPVLDADGNKVDEEYAEQVRVIRRLLKCNQIFIAERELASLPGNLWFPERDAVERRAKKARQESERLAHAIRDLAEIRDLIRQNRIYELAGRMAGIAPDLWFPEREDVEAGIKEAKIQCDRLFEQAEVFRSQGAYAKALGCAQTVLQYIPDHPDAKSFISYIELAIAIKERGGAPETTLVNPLAQNIRHWPLTPVQTQSEDTAEDIVKDAAKNTAKDTAKVRRTPHRRRRQMPAPMRHPIIRLVLALAAAIVALTIGVLALKTVLNVVY